MRMASEQYSILTVRLYPAALGTRHSVTLYEDDGESREYQQGDCAETVLTYENRNGTHVLEMSGTQGSYAGQPMERSYSVELHGVVAVKSVLVYGHTAPFKLDIESGICRVELPASPLTTAFTVEIMVDEIAPEVIRARHFVRRAELLLGRSLSGLTPVAIVAEFPTAEVLRLAGCGIFMKNENPALRGDKTHLKFYPGSQDTLRATGFKASYQEANTDGRREVFAAEFSLHDSKFPVRLPAFNVDDTGIKRRIELTVNIDKQVRSLLYECGM
jgi:hypothetical protein